MVSGFDTTRFQFFLFLGIDLFLMFFSHFVTLSHYWQFTYYIIGVQIREQLII